jgi:uridine kinase
MDSHCNPPSLVKPAIVVTPSQPRNCVQLCLPDGRSFEAPPGTALGEFIRAAFPDDFLSIAGAVVNGRLRELTCPVRADASVTPVRLTDSDGVRIYRRSLTFLLVAAAAEVFPAAEILISHAAYPSGYYCEVHGRAPFTQTELDRIEARMREIVAADEPFTKTQVLLSQAVEIFQAAGEEDKVRLMAYRRQTTLGLYALREHRDYFQGYLLPSTGYLQQFALHAVSPGFILQFPHQDAPHELPPIRSYPKLFAVFDEAAYRLDRLGIRSVGVLNDAIAGGYLAEIALIAEAFHSFQLARIAADLVAQRDWIKIVLIAGPSASAKTTFSKRLAVQLLAQGLRPYPISLDDYFVNRDQTPRDANGEYDYESLRAVDIDLFNRNLLAMTAGQAVGLPRYNFVTGRREAGPTVKLGPDSLIIIEGIHGLNPALVPDLPPERLYRVYISALTQLNFDRHNRVSTTDSRLIRRIVRDAAGRGYSATDTLQRWEAVKRGEKQNIFPFQENSDVIFNSALVHELAVLRPLAEPRLLQVRPDRPEFREAKRLLAFLQWFRPASSDCVPDNSLLREFIAPSTIFDELDLIKFCDAGPYRKRI